MKSRFPFFAEIKDKDHTLIQVLSVKAVVEDSEYSAAGKIVKMTGSVTEKISYVVLGEDVTRWRTDLEYIKVNDIIIEKEFPEYLV